MKQKAGPGFDPRFVHLPEQGNEEKESAYIVLPPWVRLEGLSGIAIRDEEQRLLLPAEGFTPAAEETLETGVTDRGETDQNSETNERQRSLLEFLLSETASPEKSNTLLPFDATQGELRFAARSEDNDVAGTPAAERIYDIASVLRILEPIRVAISNLKDAKLPPEYRKFAGKYDVLSEHTGRLLDDYDKLSIEQEKRRVLVEVRRSHLPNISEANKRRATQDEENHRRARERSRGPMGYDAWVAPLDELNDTTRRQELELEFSGNILGSLLVGRTPVISTVEDAIRLLDIYVYRGEIFTGVGVRIDLWQDVLRQAQNVLGTDTYNTALSERTIKLAKNSVRFVGGRSPLCPPESRSRK